MIAIIDYGMGNLRSVQKALQYLNVEAVIAADRATVREASHVILPGVGAFGDAMAELSRTGLGDALREAADDGKPTLGICLGMQLLFAYSEEGGHHKGLGLLSGGITRLSGVGLKVPHMGWNSLSLADCPLFTGLPEAPYVYFVHSYHAAEITPAHTAATATYGTPFTAAVQKGHLFGAQFHPEKSGNVGLAMLKNFAEYKGGKSPC